MDAVAADVVQAVGAAGVVLDVVAVVALFAVVDLTVAAEVDDAVIAAGIAVDIVAIVALDERPVDDVFELVRRAAPYRSLAREPFEAVLDMLSGRYPSDDFAELRPRIVWDRTAGTMTARSNARSASSNRMRASAVGTRRPLSRWNRALMKPVA